MSRESRTITIGRQPHPIEVAVSSRDWFAVYIGETPAQTVVYLRRSELRALRDVLHELDQMLPEPTGKDD